MLGNARAPQKIRHLAYGPANGERYRSDKLPRGTVPGHDGVSAGLYNRPRRLTRDAASDGPRHSTGFGVSAVVWDCFPSDRDRSVRWTTQ
jgi:hypothetical protein